jgi:hypothetical protein
MGWFGALIFVMGAAMAALGLVPLKGFEKMSLRVEIYFN